MTEIWWKLHCHVSEVRVVYVDLSANLAREALAFNRLDEQERERAQRIRAVVNRRQFMLCRAALRANLCELVGCRNSALHFTAIRNEKPKAMVGGRPIGLEFNVSHTVGHGLLAFAKHGRLGVDVEHRKVRHDVGGEIRKVFSDREQQALSEVCGDLKVELFLRLWTIKEALIKATGEGFRADTTAFSVPDDYIYGNKCSRFRFPIEPSVEWQLINLDTDSFAAALAHESF